MPAITDISGSADEGGSRSFLEAGVAAGIRVYGIKIAVDTRNWANTPCVFPSAFSARGGVPFLKTRALLD